MTDLVTDGHAETRRRRGWCVRQAAEGALKTEGFKPVRVLGEADGLKFTEGLKT